MNNFNPRTIFYSLLCIGALASSAPVFAATAASGSAQGAGVALTLAPTLGASAQLNVGPLPAVSASAAPNYNTSQSAASLSGSLGVLGNVISTGVLQVNVAGDLAANTSTATASVNNLNVGLAALLNLHADTVVANASVSCAGGVTQYAGSTTLTNPSLSLLGLGTAISASPAPNTVINVLGVQIILNEQIRSGNTMTVTAIRVHLGANLPLIGNLSGDIAVASASASMTSTCATSVGPAGAPDLTVAIGAPNAAFKVGETSNVDVSVNNHGTADAPASQVATVTIPATLSVPALFSSNGWSCVAPLGNATCTRSAVLAVGATSTFTLPITPRPEAANLTVGLNVTVAPVTGETNTADNSASRNAAVAAASTPVTPVGGAPDLQLTIGQPTPGLVVGKVSLIPVSVTNIGTAVSPASHIVTLELAPGLSAPAVFVENGWSCSASGSAVSCELPQSLAAGSATAFTVPVTPGAGTQGTTKTVNGNTPGKPGETNLVNNSNSMTSATAVAPAGTIVQPELHVNYQDVWYDPEQGARGVGVFHQGDVVAFIFYLHGSSNEPFWLHGFTQKQSQGVYSGQMYLMTGPAYAAPDYDKSLIHADVVGHMTFNFTNAYEGTLNFTLGGVSYTRKIQRFTHTSLGNLGGTYRYARRTTLSSCNNPASNGTAVTSGSLVITMAGSQYTATDTMDGNGACTTAGSISQQGSLYLVKDRTTTCSGRTLTGTSLVRFLEGAYIEDGMTGDAATGCIERTVTTAVR